ncbi:MAG: hypothetical protein IJS52_08930 [Bacilli bacterium]|nr:hypothetical protein [Bacilli bacterium]
MLLKEEYREAQIKASLRVNEQLLRFYYHVGEDICNKTRGLSALLWNVTPDAFYGLDAVK